MGQVPVPYGVACGPQLGNDLLRDKAVAEIGQGLGVGRATSCRDLAYLGVPIGVSPASTPTALSFMTRSSGKLLRRCMPCSA